MIFWLLSGFIAGTVAKFISKQEETGGWITSILLGIVGSLVGGFLFNLVGIQTSGFIGSTIAATIGAILTLFIYYKYLADKWNLKI